jgi:hypothetical protein
VLLSRSVKQLAGIGGVTTEKVATNNRRRAKHNSAVRKPANEEGSSGKHTAKEDPFNGGSANKTQYPELLISNIPQATKGSGVKAALQRAFRDFGECRVKVARNSHNQTR